MALFRNNSLTYEDIKFSVIKFIQANKSILADKASAKKCFNSYKEKLNVDGSFEFKTVTINNTLILYAFGKVNKEGLTPRGSVASGIPIFVIFTIKDNSEKVSIKEFSYQQLYNKYGKPAKKEESKKEKLSKALREAAEYLSDNKSNSIDDCVKKYIEKDISKFKVGKAAIKEFDGVESTLNIDNAFIFETKTISDVPVSYMKSSKSGTLIQVYFAIKDEAGHIELSVKELMDECNPENNKKEDTKTMSKENLTENMILLKRAKTLIEAADYTCEGLEEAIQQIETAKTKEVVTEAITALYEKACLCESAEDAAPYIEKAEQLTEAISDKPEPEIDDTTKEVVTEAITALYEKACLCESAEDAAPYIEKAEELQKAISDIPEEKPVVDDEYPADAVTGGEGGGSDSDDIKDLLDGDAEALKLLTDDDSSVTIDA